MSEYIIDLDGSNYLRKYRNRGIQSVAGWPVTGEIVRCEDCEHVRFMVNDSPICTRPLGNHESLWTSPGNFGSNGKRRGA